MGTGGSRWPPQDPRRTIGGIPGLEALAVLGRHHQQQRERVIRELPLEVPPPLDVSEFPLESAIRNIQSRQ